ncbi:carbamoyl-phosphate synthase subunit L [Kiloniella spongiae]|uniref:Carbamoyl-phosphate synthase subunit L n=1 Tax=Kiloniella spongiae TaxID=1489064 RepID=A0A0H2MHT8_9PROT|nr:ATP-grasp domain-containing protein [Kiloniella spongiae]KLN60317.1 carbamoyl-phosphate synthase subunit L [Kiloniella spongiae]
MRTILVSGASGIVGYGILRSLQQAKSTYKLIGTSIYCDSVAPGFCDFFIEAPATNDPSYLDWLLDTIDKYNVDMIIPGIEADVYKWILHVEDIIQSGAFPLINTTELVKLCKDKWVFYNKLVQSGLPCVIRSSLDRDFIKLEQSFGLPFILKPREGFGSKGVKKITDIKTFLEVKKEIGEQFMAQELVGTDEDEYTTAAFCDGRGGYVGAITLRRKLSKDGFTEKAEVISSDDFAEIISELCWLLKPVGPTNFQFRKDGESIKLLEINPRISSSTSIRTAFGYNESEMAVNYFLEKQEQTQPILRMGRAVRYTDEYVFYDDSIYL